MGVVQQIFKFYTPEEQKFSNQLQALIGIYPRNLQIYRRAFTHRSFQKKDEFGNDLNFERLEFLGDAILDSIVTAYLFEELPDADEGYLTKMRSKIVSRQSLNNLGKKLNLLSFMTVGGDESRFGKNIYGNLLEALVGAIYQDRGYKDCRKFILQKIIRKNININRLEGKIMSYKSYLIEWCQKEKKSFVFENCEDCGREAVKYFAVKLKISGDIVAKARCTSKKKAEEKAAKRAYFALQEQIELQA